MLPEISVLEPDKNIPDYPPSADNFIYEPKYDGLRVLIYFDREANDLSLFSKQGQPVKVTHDFMEKLKELLSPVCKTCILDGELIAVDKDHICGNYDALLDRHKKPVMLQVRVFDLLYFNNVDVRGYSTTERKKALLQKFDIKAIQFRLVPFADSIEALPARYPNQEGYVAKQKSARYESGRQRTWVKIKDADTEMVMCTGFSEGLGYNVNHIGCLHISWLIHDQKAKTFTLKDAGVVNDFVTLDAFLRVERHIRDMGSNFQKFPIEISYLRKTADNKAYHATFHRIVSLEG